jgi:hypothetical protein
MKCLNNRLLNNLNNLNNKLYTEKNKLEMVQEALYNDAMNEPNDVYESFNNNNVYESFNNNNVVEGFLDGFSSLFSSTPNNGLPVAPGTLDKQNINVLETKINDRMKRSTSFPPKEDDDPKDSDNKELLNSIKGIKPNLQNNSSNKTIENLSISNPSSASIPSNVLSKSKLLNVTNNPSNIEKKPIVVQPLKNVLGTCNFFNDKCPDDYQPLGNFSINGTGSNTVLACGNVDNVKPAKAIAIIKSNSIHEINIMDPGFGFNPNRPPKIYIEGGKGNGATAEAVIDDNGYLKLIKVIHPGYNYTETPNVIIDAPFMNSSCHLCCKL